MLNIVGKKKIYFTVSGILIAASLLAIIFFGFRQGIDFLGGTLWQFKITKDVPQLSILENIFKTDLNMAEAKLNFDSTSNTFFVRLPTFSESSHQDALKILKTKFPELEELGFQSIGPSVGHELRKNALIAMVLAIVGISLYIAFAFRKVSRPVSSWKYGLVTLFTLFHDVLIPAGLLALLGRFLGVEIDSNFAVALLVVAGFSVHDTIVVFDRIRENISLDRGKSAFDEVVNRSVNQTLARSINTSLTLILVLLALLFAGPTTLKYFLLALLVGVTTGIYSSIFIASPLLTAWHKLTKK
ncbi:MAG: protein translocase subunit SecF [Candidatus Liptonbacteria bacterium]|nr:protein translocase subunit SecF [Candidatus Liptonbacteria bacterium]